MVAFQLATQSAPQRCAKPGMIAFTSASLRRASSAGVTATSFMEAGWPSLQVGLPVLQSIPVWVSVLACSKIEASSFLTLVSRNACTFGSSVFHQARLARWAARPKLIGIGEMNFAEFMPLRAVAGQRAGDGAIDHAAGKCRLHLRERDGDRRAAEVGDECLLRGAGRTHLAPLEVGDVGEGIAAVDHLGLIGAEAKKFQAVLLLEELGIARAQYFDGLLQFLHRADEADQVGRLVHRHFAGIVVQDGGRELQRAGRNQPENFRPLQSEFGEGFQLDLDRTGQLLWNGLVPERHFAVEVHRQIADAADHVERSCGQPLGLGNRRQRSKADGSSRGKCGKKGSLRHDQDSLRAGPACGLAISSVAAGSAATARSREMQLECRSS